jgi:hypothetical protein
MAWTHTLSLLYIRCMGGPFFERPERIYQSVVLRLRLGHDFRADVHYPSSYCWTTWVEMVRKWDDNVTESQWGFRKWVVALSSFKYCSEVLLGREESKESQWGYLAAAAAGIKPCGTWLQVPTWLTCLEQGGEIIIEIFANFSVELDFGEAPAWNRQARGRSPRVAFKLSPLGTSQMCLQVCRQVTVVTIRLG